MRKKDTGKVYAMKIIHKDVLRRKDEVVHDTFNRELSERKHLAGLINVDKAAYKHWLVRAAKAERRVLEVAILSLPQPQSAARFRLDHD